MNLDSVLATLNRQCKLPVCCFCFCISLAPVINANNHFCRNRVFSLLFCLSNEWRHVSRWFIKNTLKNLYLPLAVFIARRLVGPSIQMEQLIQITKRAKSKKWNANYWNPSIVRQHKRVLSEIGGKWTPNFRFKNCYKNTCLRAWKSVKSSTIPVCLSEFVWVMTSPARV